MAQGDHYKMLVREFTDVGIRPKIEITNGNHYRFSFEFNGRSESQIAAFTPSDWRSTLNARALLRRKFRALGVYDQQNVKPPELVKAMDLPPGTDPLAARVAQLERDTGLLLEFLHEITEDAANIAFRAGWTAHAEAIQKASVDLLEPRLPRADAASNRKLTQTRIARSATNPQQREKKKSKSETVLETLRFDKWLGVKDLTQRLGMTSGQISNHLCILHGKRLVENADFKWRRRTLPMNGHDHH